MESDCKEYDVMETAEDNVPPEEKQKKIQEALNLLQTILYNPTRKGLHKSLMNLTRVQKHRLFR